MRVCPVVACSRWNPPPKAGYRTSFSSCLPRHIRSPSARFHLLVRSRRYVAHICCSCALVSVLLVYSRTLPSGCCTIAPACVLASMSWVGRERGRQKALSLLSSPTTTTTSTWPSNEDENMIVSQRRRHRRRRRCCFGIMFTAAATTTTAPAPANSLRQPLHNSRRGSSATRGGQAVTMIGSGTGTRTQPACRSLSVPALQGARLLDSEGRATSASGITR